MQMSSIFDPADVKCRVISFWSVWKRHWTNIETSTATLNHKVLVDYEIDNFLKRNEAGHSADGPHLGH